MSSLLRPPRGRLTLFCGPMRSGKSTRLIIEVRKFVHAQQRVLFVCHSCAAPAQMTETTTTTTTTTTAAVANRNDLVAEADYRATLPDPSGDYDVLAIDEAQFFDDLCSKVDAWLREGKTVLAAGLDCDYQLRPFGQLPQLLAWASEVTKLTAICARCLKFEALFSKRLTRERDLVVTDRESYEPRCRRCIEWD